MILLGRGQRELIIGDRGTGKTAIAVDTIINQRSTDVICVYAAVGQKASSIAQLIDAVRRFGAPDRCLFVVGEADAAPGLQWLTPYAAGTMAEYFMRPRPAISALTFRQTSFRSPMADLSRSAPLLRRPKPAVDVGKSVSRVGGKTQAPVLKSLSESLRLEYFSSLRYSPGSARWSMSARVN
jgi:F0F1-type ATP synthase alpha subunit